MSERLDITIFTDFASPHCYVTEQALRAAAADRPLSIRYRALEMHPAPVPLPPAAEAAKWAEDARAHAGGASPTLTPPPLVPRTRKAHEAALFAAEHGVGDAFRDAVFRAFWEDGRDIGRIDVLAEIGAAVDLDPEDVRITLDIDRFDEAVRSDGEVARRLNVRHVPTTYLGAGGAARILIGVQTRPALDSAIDSR